MSITLQQARSRFVKLAPPDEIDERINLASELLLTEASGKDSRQGISILAANGLITLPRQYSALHGFAIENHPVSVYNHWYSLSLNGPGVDLNRLCSNIALEVGDNFCTIRDITSISEAGCRLKVYQDFSEADVTLILKGFNSAGEVLRSTFDSGATYIDGEEVVASVAGTLTTQTFLSLTQIVKPITKAPVRIYAVHPTTSVETLVGIYAPTETDPCWRRYRVPLKYAADGTTDLPYLCTALVQLRQVDAVADTDLLPISNANALGLAMQAIQARYSNDPVREQALTAQAVMLLNKESAKFRPPSSFATLIQFVPGTHAGSGVRRLY